MLGITPGILISGETSPMEQPQYKKCELKVGGMGCNKCANILKTELNNKSGVKETKVDLKSAKAFIEYDPAIINIEQLVQTIHETGFKSSMPGKKDKPKNESFDTKEKKETK